MARRIVWRISGEEFMAALKRVADGQDPEIVYLECYANSKLEEE